MIITSRAPVRIDFAGAWTDVSYFADAFGGATLNAAIRMHVSGSLEANEEETNSAFLSRMVSGPNGWRGTACVAASKPSAETRSQAGAAAATPAAPVSSVRAVSTSRPSGALRSSTEAPGIASPCGSITFTANGPAAWRPTHQSIKNGKMVRTMPPRVAQHVNSCELRLRRSAGVIA